MGEESVEQAVQQVLNDRGLRPATQPSVDLLNQDAVAATGLTTDLEFKVAVEVLPEITPPDFAALSLTRLTSAVSDEVLGKAPDTPAARHAPLETTGAHAPGDRGADTGAAARRGAACGAVGPRPTAGTGPLVGRGR